MSMIRLAAIKKSYESAAGEVTALKGVDLEIERGEIYGIIGLSGAGKSTLIRCINMLERPTEGKVIVDGKDLTALSEAELREERKGIGMIFQHFNLLSSATVYDNVAFPLRLSGTDEAQIRTKVEPLLALVGLADKAQQYPAQLSGGQKQRVFIARALAQDAQLYIMDEPLAGVDETTERIIMDKFMDLQKEKRTVIAVHHDLSTLDAYFDYLVVLNRTVKASGYLAGIDKEAALARAYRVKE